MAKSPEKSQNKNIFNKLLNFFRTNEQFGILKRLVRENIRQYGMFLALVIIVVYFNFATNGVSLRPLNVNNIILQNAHVIILAVGMLIVILTGNIDLSVGSVAAFVGAIAGILMVRNDVSWQLALVISLMIGILAGAWNGFWIAYIKIPAFIVTLGGMLIFRGLTLASLEGVTLGPLPDGFNRLSSGFLPDIVSDSPIHVLTVLVGLLFSVGYIVSTVLARRKKQRYNFEVSPIWITVLGLVIVITAINLFTLTLARHRGFPNVSVILLITIVIYAFITKKTTLGRHVYALGGNAEAAKLSGINTKRTMFLVYTNMGFLAALSGVVYAARLNASTPKAGELFELDAIASAFIGGASASGGVGTVVGAVIGALVMGVINNGMSLLGLGIDWQQVVKGLVLLLAVWFDIATKNRAK
jgi:putative multiple sugar transport system permease protein